MKSIIRQSDGRWCVVVRVRVSGKIVQKRKTIIGTKEQAKALREQIKSDLRAGATPNCSLTLSPTKLKDILKLYRDKKGPFSMSHESNVVRIEDGIGESDLNLVPERFEKIIASLRVKGKNYQANRFIEVVRAAYQLSVSLGILKINPITAARFPEYKETARDIYLPAEEITKIILTAAKNRRTCHIARLLQFYFSVPSRKSEVLRMKIIDCDIFRKRIRVHNGTTKNDVGTWKPIPPSMLSWFKRRIRDSTSLDEPIFYRYVKVKDKRVPIGDFKNAWGTVRTKVGYPDLHIHDSRHISATDMVNNGTPRTVVNAVANWKTDMLRSYYHLDSDAALDHIQWNVKPHCEAFVKPCEAQAV